MAVREQHCDSILRIFIFVCYIFVLFSPCHHNLSFILIHHVDEIGISVSSTQKWSNSAENSASTLINVSKQKIIEINDRTSNL